MKSPAELEALFEKNFREGMINKDFNAFKRGFPTLLKVIKKTLLEIESTKK